MKTTQSLPSVDTESLLKLLNESGCEHLTTIQIAIQTQIKSFLECGSGKALIDFSKHNPQLKKAIFNWNYSDGSKPWLSFNKFLKLFIEDYHENSQTLFFFREQFENRKLKIYPEGSIDEYIQFFLKDIKSNIEDLKTILQHCLTTRSVREEANNKIKNKILSTLKNHPDFYNEVARSDKFLMLRWILKDDEIPVTEKVKQSFELGSLDECLTALSKEQIDVLAKNIIYDKKFSAMVLPYFNKLLSIEIYDGGASNDTWWILADAVLKNMTLTGFTNERKSFVTDFVNGWNKNVSAEEFNIGIEISSGDFQFNSTLNRTLLFENSSNELLAIKIQKNQESEMELHKQCETVKFLKIHESDLNLPEQVVKPLGVKKLTDLASFCAALVAEGKMSKEELDTLMSKIKNDSDSHYAYVYIAPKEYFKYLHNDTIKPDAFFESCIKTFAVYLSLLDQGIVLNQLADIYHSEDANRIDAGRYITLINLMGWGIFGGGRLDAWQKAVKYLNIREKVGLADEGDWQLIEAFVDATQELAKKYFALAHNKHGKHVDIYIVANFIAEFFLIIELAAGNHVVNKLKTNPNLPQEEINTLWREMVKLLHRIYVECFAKFTNLPIDVAKYLFDQVCDVQTYTKQMQYWMTTNYIDDLKNNKIPASIYPGTNVRLNFNNIRPNTFHDKIGLSINGKDQDIGSVNSQYLIKAGEASRYHFITFGFAGRNAVHESNNLEEAGRNYESQENYRQAKECYQKAIELNIFSKTARQSLMKVSQKIANMTNDDTDVENAKITRRKTGAALILRNWSIWRYNHSLNKSPTHKDSSAAASCIQKKWKETRAGKNK